MSTSCYSPLEARFSPGAPVHFISYTVYSPIQM